MNAEIDFPEGSEIACPGLSINITLRFDVVPEPSVIEKHAAVLSDEGFYTGINKKLLAFTESQIRVHFFKPPWKRITFRCPTLYENYEESEPTEAELKRLVMLGLDLEIYIQDENYNHLYQLVESDDFCDECERIVQNAVQNQMKERGLTVAEASAEVVECGGG